jgi:hypothetical protein
MICEGCGYLNSPCSYCEQATLRAFDEESAGAEKNIAFDGFPEMYVVEEEDWDGTDLFTVHGSGGGDYVSTKAKAALEDLGVAELVFKPALLNVAKVWDWL